MDPFTIMAGATTAYNAIKKGIELGRELHDMGSQLSQWGSAIADMDFIHSQAENPPWYKMGGGADAATIFANKKKLQAQRAELKQYLQFSYGQSGWEEYLQIEADVRRLKQKNEHRKVKQMRKLIEIGLAIIGIAVFLGITGTVFYYIGVWQGKW